MLNFDFVVEEISSDILISKAFKSVSKFKKTFLCLSRFLKFTVILTLLTVVSQIFALPHHLPSPYAHHAVLENDAQEAYIPEHLKNPFYKTPRWRVKYCLIKVVSINVCCRVRNVLAWFSSLHYGETPVKNRIADAVPRKEIYKLLTHAGLVPRSNFPYVWKAAVKISCKYRIKMLTTNLYRIKIKWRMNHRRCSLARVKIIPRANCANSKICICRQAFHKWISLQFSCLRSFSVSSSRLNFPDGNIFVSLTDGKHKSFFLLLIFIDVKELAT